MLNIQNAEKCFITKTIKTRVFHHLNLAVEQGEFVSIMGPSGSGKSTLLNIIGMFDSLDSGSLTLAGKDVISLSYSQRIIVRRELISYIVLLLHKDTFVFWASKYNFWSIISYFLFNYKFFKKIFVTRSIFPIFIFKYRPSANASWLITRTPFSYIFKSFYIYIF